MEKVSHPAHDRGTYTPQLKLGQDETPTPMPPQLPPHQSPDDSYYSMANKRHGVALIINNIEFTKHPKRIGSERDEHNLVQTFLSLGYRVEVRRNCSSRQLVTLFSEADQLLAKADKEEKLVSLAHDSFVSCILSHGDDGMVCGSDSKSVRFEELERALGRSKTLRGKPKLFFVQACRGTNIGAEIQSDDGRGLSESANVNDRSDMFFSYATVLATLPTGTQLKGPTM